MQKKKILIVFGIIVVSTCLPSLAAARPIFFEFEIVKPTYVSGWYGNIIGDHNNLKYNDGSYLKFTATDSDPGLSIDFPNRVYDYKFYIEWRSNDPDVELWCFPNSTAWEFTLTQQGYFSASISGYLSVVAIYFYNLNPSNYVEIDYVWVSYID